MICFIKIIFYVVVFTIFLSYFTKKVYSFMVISLLQYLLNKEKCLNTCYIVITVSFFACKKKENQKETLLDCWQAKKVCSILTNTLLAKAVSMYVNSLYVIVTSLGSMFGRFSTKLTRVVCLVDSLPNKRPQLG